MLPAMSDPTTALSAEDTAAPSAYVNSHSRNNVDGASPDTLRRSRRYNHTSAVSMTVHRGSHNDAARNVPTGSDGNLGRTHRRLPQYSLLPGDPGSE